MRLRILALLTTALFSNEPVMERFHGILSDEDYEWIEAQGLKKFKYYNCNEASSTTETLIKNKYGEVLGWSSVANDKRSENVEIANELLEKIKDFMYYEQYIQEYKDEATQYEKKLAALQKELSEFFTRYHDKKDINLLYEPVDVIKEDGTWWCHEEVKRGLMQRATSYYFTPSHVKIFYDMYKKELENLLTKESFVVFGLLAHDFTFSDDDVHLVYRHYKYDKNFLDLLLEQSRFEIIKQYKSTLMKNYSTNPFYVIIKKSQYTTTEKEVHTLRKLGFDLFRYSDNIENTKIEHNDDNLYLALKYDLCSYRHFVKSTDTLKELIDNLKPLDKLDIYIYYAIDYNNYEGLVYLFEHYPEHHYTKNDISRYILYASREYSLDMVKYLIERFPYDEYDDIVDEETGLNALGYAKEAGYSGEKLVAYLEKHNFKAQFWKDRKRDISNFVNATGEVINGIGFLIGIALGASIQ